MHEAEYPVIKNIYAKSTDEINVQYRSWRLAVGSYKHCLKRLSDSNTQVSLAS